MARVYRDGTLIFTLQTNDRLISATAQAGIIHAPTAAKAVPVNEGDYQPPQIWPVPPYATLFAWPYNQGIGAWDQIFEPDPNARMLTLAETKDGVLDTWDCPIWQTRTPLPVPTATPVPVAPTATPTETPVAPTVTPTITTAPTETPLAPTVTPTITVTPTETPLAPTVTPTITVTPTETPLAPTVTPTITVTPNPCLVTTEADDVTTPPAGSLRQVLANNPCCTTITFMNTVNTITLAGAQLDIPGTCTNLTIDGSGGAGGHVTISGNNASRVLYVNSGADATLSNLTITQGNAGDGNGGGIYNYGTVTVNGMVSNNTAGNGTGGGIFNNSGTLTINGTISNNIASGSGGGIDSYVGTLTVNGMISNNTAGNSGGGIYNSMGTLTVSGTVNGNTSPSQGGGIYNWSGTLTLNSGHLIQGNHCDNDNLGPAFIGGGIWTDGMCPVGANYGTNNFRGSGTTVIDNCNGNP